MQIIMQWIYRNINSPFFPEHVWIHYFSMPMWLCAYTQINRYWEQDEK